MTGNGKKVFLSGMRDGAPIALGYLAVAFTLGIIAREAGLNAVEGFIVSALNLASAGEYAGFITIKSDAAYLEIILITLVANARYLLMTSAISQKFSSKTRLIHRLAVGFGITDEIFGITIRRKGALNPYYNYGAMAVAVPAWAVGTSIGIDAGNVLPPFAVSALGVALYGMFLAVIIPPAKEEKFLGRLILISFAMSFAAANSPLLKELSSGTLTIVLTLIIAGAAAYFKPIKEVKK